MAHEICSGLPKVSEAQMKMWAKNLRKQAEREKALAKLPLTDRLARPNRAVSRDIEPEVPKVKVG